jgi:hypothetical protein
MFIKKFCLLSIIAVMLTGLAGATTSDHGNNHDWSDNHDHNGNHQMDKRDNNYRHDDNRMNDGRTSGRHDKKDICKPKKYGDYRDFYNPNYNGKYQLKDGTYTLPVENKPISWTDKKGVRHSSTVTLYGMRKVVDRQIVWDAVYAEYKDDKVLHQYIHAKRNNSWELSQDIDGYILDYDLQYTRDLHDATRINELITGYSGNNPIIFSGTWKKIIGA